MLFSSFRKSFDNTIRGTLLWRVRCLKQVHFFNRKSISFHTLLSVRAFPLLFFRFNRYQTFLLFSPHWKIRSFITFPLLIPFLPHSFNSKMSTLKDQGKTNRNILLLSFHILQNEEFHAHFSGGKQNVLRFLQWVRESPNNDAEELVAVMQ